MKSAAERAITPDLVRGAQRHERTRDMFLALLPAFDPDLPPIGIALVIAIVIISLGIHEAAHGWVALQCGDPTARDLGRITLNPLAHIDPVMSIVLPLLTYLTAGRVFGGAKPVPVSYHNLRSPLRDMAIVAIAGPLSNFLIAAFLWLCLKLIVEVGQFWGNESLGTKVLTDAVFANVLLSAFNLLPIPPLDGSRVMAWLLPSGVREPYRALESWGLMIVFFAMTMHPVQVLIGNTMDHMMHWIDAIVTLGGLW